MCVQPLRLQAARSLPAPRRLLPKGGPLPGLPPLLVVSIIYYTNE